LEDSAVKDYEVYMESKSSIVQYMDAEILHGTLKPFQLAQMCASLEERYQKWEVGQVPEDIMDRAIKDWYEQGRLHGFTLWDFLRISKDQFERHVKPTLSEELADAVWRQDIESTNVKR
jgi:hypothetical protein